MGRDDNAVSLAPLFRSSNICRQLTAQGWSVPVEDRPREQDQHERPEDNEHDHGLQRLDGYLLDGTLPFSSP